jgi:hypothetical protein
LVELRMGEEWIDWSHGQDWQWRKRNGEEELPDNLEVSYFGTEDGWRK